MIPAIEESFPLITTASETRQDLALFKLGQQMYALPVEVIVQIIPLVTIIRLPQAHRAILGVIDVRGALTPVVSLASLLGLPELVLRLHTPILLVRHRNYTLGMIVEDVVDVMTVTGQEVESSDDIIPETLRNNTALVALANTARGTIFILDIAHLLGESLDRELETIGTTITPEVNKAETAVPPAPSSIPEKYSPPSVELPPSPAQMKTETNGRKEKSDMQTGDPAPGGSNDDLKPDPKLDPGRGAMKASMKPGKKNRKEKPGMQTGDPAPDGESDDLKHDPESDPGKNVNEI